MKENKLAFSFDATKKARFGVLPRYAKNELLIKWFELPNCFIFHNGGALCSLPYFLSIEKVICIIWGKPVVNESKLSA